MLHIFSSTLQMDSKKVSCQFLDLNIKGEPEIKRSAVLPVVIPPVVNVKYACYLEPRSALSERRCDTVEVRQNKEETGAGSDDQGRSSNFYRVLRLQQMQGYSFRNGGLLTRWRPLEAAGHCFFKIIRSKGKSGMSCGSARNLNGAAETRQIKAWSAQL